MFPTVGVLVLELFNVFSEPLKASYRKKKRRKEKKREIERKSCDGNSGQLHKSLFVDVPSVDVGAFLYGLGVDYASVFELVEDAF